MNEYIDFMQTLTLAGLMAWAIRAHGRIFGWKRKSSVTRTPTEPRD